MPYKPKSLKPEDKADERPERKLSNEAFVSELIEETDEVFEASSAKALNSSNHLKATPYENNSVYNTPVNLSATNDDNVLSFFCDPTAPVIEKNKIIQVYPETSGIKMLYASSEKRDRYVAVPIVCWALQTNGNIVGLVPWINEVLPCDVIAKRFDLCWEGYYDEFSGEVLAFPPGYAIAMLTTAARFKREQVNSVAKANSNIVEDFSDQVGTHVLLLNAETQSLNLAAVVCWQLDTDGVLHAMLSDESRAEKFPVVAGDPCLYRALENQHFRCYFQRDIAHQIRSRDSETLQAIEELFILED